MEKENGKRKKFLLHEFRKGDDIKYRGPLNYQHFQMAGWICIVMIITAMLMRVGNRVGTTKGQLSDALYIVETIASMALPFLLLANFAEILNNRIGYKKLLIKNGLAMLGIAGVFWFFYFRYVLGTLTMISNDPESVGRVTDVFLDNLNPAGFFSFNIFTDMFLCVLVMFFLNAQPSPFFTGWKKLVFRGLGILPLIYEVVCTWLKYRSVLGEYLMPVWLYPLLPSKPPMTFVLFILLAIYIKTRERRFCRHGRTHEEYQAFLTTNRNSLSFSVFLMAAVAVVCVIDQVVDTVSASNEIDLFLEANPDAVQSIDFENYSSVMRQIGFGEAIPMFFMIPLIPLFSYNREPKHPEIGAYIPMGGFVLIALVVVQSIYQLAHVISLPKISLEEVYGVILMFMHPEGL